MDIEAFDLMLPMIGAAAAGGLIGAEREYRASPAGFRTHILVGLSSGLLMLAAVHQMHWLTDTPHEIIRIDPVRMAHGVLTGIGFLCGGVIGREALNGETDQRPVIAVATTGISPAAPGYVLGFKAINKTGRTAAAVEIEAVLTDGGKIVETAEATLDYVPGHGKVEGGVFFAKDPRGHSLQIRALGFQIP